MSRDKIYTQRYEKIKETFNNIEFAKNLPLYQTNKSYPNFTDMDFLEKIQWVNLRTSANFDLCCSLCGESNGVEMHHIKAIRKPPYNLIPEKLPWVTHKL